MAMNMQVIHSECEFLLREPKHETEKPYQIRYNVSADFPKTNMIEERKNVSFQNFRPYQNSQSLHEFGFTCVKLGRAFDADDLSNEKVVITSYYTAIEQAIKSLYPEASKIKILEHDFRRRDSRFPHGDYYESQQPSVLAHIDFTLKSAIRTAEAAFGISPDQYRRAITINFWKSFQGPGNDWPLGLCGCRTFRRGRDSCAVDVVYHDSFTENESVYYSPDHRWYYFQDLASDEAIAFIQSDTDEEEGGGVPHVSFYNPKADKDAMARRSIEVRAFVFFT